MGLDLTNAWSGCDPADAIIAAKRATSIPSAQPYDVVFMDDDMPVMGGMAAVEAIRGMETALSKPHTPIVATVLSDDRRADALRVGCDLVVCKPILRARVLAALRALCPRFATAAAAASRLERLLTATSVALPSTARAAVGLSTPSAAPSSVQDELRADIAALKEAEKKLRWEDAFRLCPLIALSRC